MKLSFVPKIDKTPIEPSSRPMSVVPASLPVSEGFFFPMPTGEDRGDIVYWEPATGEDGAWVKLDAPNATPLQPELLTHDGGNLFWARGLPRGTAKNQMLYWDPASGDSGAWVILREPTSGSNDEPSFLRFTGSLNWGEGGGGGGLPDGAIAKEFDICENGQPTTYWFAVWENEPDLTASEE